MLELLGNQHISIIKKINLNIIAVLKKRWKIEIVKTGGRPENPQIAEICAQIAEEETVNTQTRLRKKIKKVIELTAHEDDRGEVWGDDIPLGKMDKLINEAEKILG